MRRLLHCLEFAFILAVTFPVSLLPLAAAQYLGDMFGVLAYHLLKGRKKIALEGIRKTLEAGCLQEHLSPEEIASNSFKNLGRSFIELIKIYRNRRTHLQCRDHRGHGEL